MKEAKGHTLWLVPKKKEYDVSGDAEARSSSKSAAEVQTSEIMHIGNYVPNTFFERTKNIDIGEVMILAREQYNIELTEDEVIDRRSELRYRSGMLGLPKRRKITEKVSGKFEEPEWQPVSLDDLTRAIMQSVNMLMEEEPAKEMANHVLGFFGYSFRIIDNVLEPEDRDAFYMLEDTGILSTAREETTLYNGKTWRIHYWLLDPRKVKEYSFKQRESAVPDDNMGLYSEIPEEVWERDSF